MAGRALLAGEVEALLAEVSGTPGTGAPRPSSASCWAACGSGAGTACPSAGWRAAGPSRRGDAARPEAARHAPRAARRLAHCEACLAMGRAVLVLPWRRIGRGARPGFHHGLGPVGARRAPLARAVLAEPSAGAPRARPVSHLGGDRCRKD